MQKKTALQHSLEANFAIYLCLDFPSTDVYFREETIQDDSVHLLNQM